MLLLGKNRWPLRINLLLNRGIANIKKAITQKRLKIHVVFMYLLSSQHFLGSEAGNVICLFGSLLAYLLVTQNDYLSNLF